MPWGLNNVTSQHGGQERQTWSQVLGLVKIRRRYKLHKKGLNSLAPSWYTFLMLE